MSGSIERRSGFGTPEWRRSGEGRVNRSGMGAQACRSPPGTHPIVFHTDESDVRSQANRLGIGLPPTLLLRRSARSGADSATAALPMVCPPQTGCLVLFQVSLVECVDKNVAANQDQIARRIASSQALFSCIPCCSIPASWPRESALHFGCSTSSTEPRPENPKTT
jgi:hypothetical protein